MNPPSPTHHPATPAGAPRDIPSLVIFDMAGTTVQDQGQVPAAFNAALAEYGVEVSPEQIKGMRGASKRQALMHFLPTGEDKTALGEKAYQSFLAHLAQEFKTRGVHAVPGAEEAFHGLRQHGVKVALNTGFDRQTASLLLDALGWNEEIVDAVVCGDEVSQGRPAPDLIFHAMAAAGVSSVHVVASVGDTTRDLQAGFNAGVRWNIGVLSGAHDRQALEKAPHTHLLPAAANVPGLWFKN